MYGVSQSSVFSILAFNIDLMTAISVLEQKMCLLEFPNFKELLKNTFRCYGNNQMKANPGKGHENVLKI